MHPVSPESEFLCVVFANPMGTAVEVDTPLGDRAGLRDDPPAVYMDIGAALVLRMPIFVVVEPPRRPPTSLAGFPAVRCSLQNRQVLQLQLQLHLGLFVKRLGQHRPQPAPAASHLTKEAIRDLQAAFGRIDEEQQPERVFEELVVRQLQESGAVTAVGRATSDE